MTDPFSSPHQSSHSMLRLRELTDDLEQIERREQRQNRLLAKLLHCAPALLCVATKERFVLVSDALSELLGWKSEELASVPLIELIHPDDRKEVSTQMRHMRERPMVHFVARFRSRRGPLRRLSWSASGWDEDGYTYATLFDLGPDDG